MRPIPQLDDQTQERLAAYADLLRQWNRRINLISRRDEDNIDSYHIPHCRLFELRTFPPGSSIVDWGTGGGLPAIVLALCNPDVQVWAVDRVEKKIRAVRAMARSLDIANLSVWNGSAEKFGEQIDYAVSRATAPLNTLWAWTQPRLIPGQSSEGEWKRGLICLKGGDLGLERADLSAAWPNTTCEVISLEERTASGVWSDKYIVHVGTTS